jgi:hypothetical protein
MRTLGGTFYTGGYEMLRGLFMKGIYKTTLCISTFYIYLYSTHTSIASLEISDLAFYMYSMYARIAGLEILDLER